MGNSTLKANEAKRKSKRKNKTKKAFEKPSTRSTAKATKVTKASSLSSEKFPNGLMKKPIHYLQIDNSYSYVVAKIGANMLKISDHRTLLPGCDLSTHCTNYILEFILPQKFKNLTLFASQIVAGNDCISYSIIKVIGYCML